MPRTNSTRRVWGVFLWWRANYPSALAGAERVNLTDKRLAGVQWQVKHGLGFLGLGGVDGWWLPLKKKSRNSTLATIYIAVRWVAEPKNECHIRF